MMRAFARWVVRHRLAVILLTAAVTALGAYATFAWSWIQSDISKYLPEDDPVVIRFTEAGERFGGVDMGMLAVEVDDAFSVESLELVQRLTEAIRQVPGITWVISMTSIDDVQAREVEGEKAVVVGKLVDPQALPRTPEERARLRAQVMGKEDMVGLVVGADERLVNVIFNLAKGVDRVIVARAVEEAARPLVGARAMHLTGFPYWTKNMSEMILHDMVTLVPIVSLVVILLLFLAFRSIRGVVLPLTTVLVSALWSMGLMAACGLPITMLSNVVPVLLIALGTAYAIHLLHKVEEMGPVAHTRDGLSQALSEVMIPILMAGVTTVIGFLSFCTSNMAFVQHTGLIAAFGTLAAMTVALTFVPAVVSYLKPRTPRRGASEGDLAPEGGWLDRLGAAIARHKGLFIGAWLLLTAGAAIFAVRLERQFDMVKYFPEDSPLRESDEVIRTRLGGNLPIWITVGGDPKEPFVLQTMLLVEKHLQAYPDIGNTRSLASILAQMNEVMSDHPCIPDTRDGVGNLWFQLEGKDVLKQLCDKPLAHSLVQGVSSSNDTVRLRVVVDQIQAFLDALPLQARQVERSRADPEDLRRAEAFALERASLAVALDLRRRLGEEAPGQGEVQRALAEGLQAKPAADADLAAALASYLRSEESDLPLADEALAGRIALALAQAAEAGRLDAEAEVILRRELPPALLEEDPEGLGYLVRSVSALCAERARGSRVAAVKARLLRSLPPDAAGDERLSRDLDGDLWPLLSPTLLLPLDAAAASALPADQVVRLEVSQTGMHAIAVSIDDQLVWSQLNSLGLAAIMALILLMIQFRSAFAGAVGMLPMSLTLLINFGVMGALRIDLDTATVLIASLVVGVGIDYTIHFMSRLRLEIDRQASQEAVLRMVLRTVGRAILINAVTIIGGMLVFLFGDLVPLHSFGLLIALAMVTSALSAMTILPAVLLLVRPRFLHLKGSPPPPSGV